ncbi:MAG: DUF2203 domain-containing protein [Candidatus Sumerlaeaceae bacterium]|nr:DUF2203 domain-containing protein [Candidatus Sumerlaeaceae bacterium]
MTPSWNFQKHFTLEEANELVGWLREKFHTIHVLSGYHSPEWRGRSANGNGKGTKDKISISTEELKAEDRRKIAEALLSEIEERGIIVRDWRRGLVDFPAIVNGIEVFYCYELSDGSAIRYYHGLNEGYAGRIPIG